MFARLNGWSIRVRDRSTSEQFERLGRHARSYDGRPLHGTRGILHGLALEALIYEREEADTLEGLLAGCAGSWPFDTDAFSDSGLGPDTASLGAWSIVPRPPTSAGVFGAGYLSVTTSIIWDLKLNEDHGWTVLLWRTVSPRSAREHIAVRSDGAKWSNGVRADGTTTTELVVDEGTGALALTAGDYDDMVVLPFPACASFIEAFYRWTTARALTFYVPFVDETGRDVVEDAPATVIGGSIARHGGRAGGCFLGATINDGLSYPTAVAAIEDLTEMSFELCVTPTTTAACVLADHDQWRLELAAGGGVVATVTTAAGDATATTTTAEALAAGEAVHLAMTWSQATGRVRLYVHGRLATGAAVTKAGAAPGADSAATLYLGQSSSGAQGLVGRLSEPRFHALALTADEVRERYLTVLEGAPGTVPRACSRLPALILEGEVAGARPRVVVATSAEQTIVQHGQRPGGTSGWKNNSRTIPFTLDQWHDDRPEGLPAPLWSFTLDERYLSGTTLRPAQRGLPGATTAGTAVYTNGPFGAGRARRFSANIADRFNLAAAHAVALFGLRAVTAIAILRRTSVTASARGVLNLANAAGNTKLCLEISSSGQVVIRGRGESTDALVTDASAGTITDAAPYHLLGGFLDISGDRTGVFLDDAGLASAPVGFYEESAATFTSLSFSAEAHAAECIIGGGQALGTPLFADLAHVALYPGVLTAVEVRRIWATVRRGALLR